MNRKLYARGALAAYVYLAPALVGLFLLTLVPVAAVIVISLTKWSVLQPPRFLGIANYLNIFSTDFYFVHSVLATLYFAIGAVVVGIVYSFTVATMLNRRIPGRGFWRSAFFVPYVLPAVATAVVWSWMYETDFGVFNFFVNSLGFHKVPWLQKSAYAVPSLIIMTVWGVGNLIVIFMAGLQNVPRSFLEAVEIDGGNAWHKFRHVTVPMMTPVIFFNFIISVITNLQVFVPAYALTSGGPGDSTLFMVFLIYREGFMRNNMGYACALSLVFFVFIALLTLLIFSTSRKWIFYAGE